MEQLPAINVQWDAAKQTVVLNFDPGEFKTWEFVEAVLQMAARDAERRGKMAMVQRAQQQQIAAAQEQAVKRKLFGG